MSRRAAFAILAASLAVVLASFGVVLAGIGSGAWTPAGPPVVTPQPTIETGPMDYGRFLEHVRAGRVVHVSLNGDQVQADEGNRSYGFNAPSGVNVRADVEKAASDGGVPPPAFDVAGPGEGIGYEEFLDRVKKGQIGDVTQEGQTLHAAGAEGTFEVAVPDPATNVLGDIEAAAREGGVQPPLYTKVPGG